MKQLIQSMMLLLLLVVTKRLRLSYNKKLDR